ncbi:ATP-binding protein [Streptosporangium sp. CA-115845]|uniref:ATP-binding protein n=1 Tax=Streptosporangium sp. CA-115845 TaxID=3240071 RepID=UPI003D8DD17C
MRRSTTGQRPRICPDADPDSGGGRGLWLVQQLSSDWGWYETSAGRVVWFQCAARRSVISPAKPG